MAGGTLYDVLHVNNVKLGIFHLFSSILPQL